MGGLPFGGDRTSTPDNADSMSALPEMPEMVANSTFPPVDEKALGAPDQSAPYPDVSSAWMRIFQDLFGFSWDGTVSDGDSVGGSQFASDVVFAFQAINAAIGLVTVVVLLAVISLLRKNVGIFYAWYRRFIKRRHLCVQCK